MPLRTGQSGHGATVAAALSAGLVENAGGLPLKTEIYIDVKPDGYAFAGDHEIKTKAEVEAGFAAFVEGTKP